MPLIKPKDVKLRLDHGPMYVCVMVGLFMVSLSLLLTGPYPDSVISNLADSTQVILSTVIFIGASMCLYGSLLGTRFCMPNADVRRALGWGIGGSIPSALSVWIYFLAIVLGTMGNYILSGLAAGLSLTIPIGALVNAYYFLVKREYLTDEIRKRSIEINESSSDDGQLG